jgi:hypothetical protein
MASEAVDQVKEGATQLADRARDSARPLLDEQKGRLVDNLGSVAYAMQESGQRLREQHHETAAKFTDQAAQRIDRVSGYLEGKDFNRLVADVEGFARREPMLFAGAAFAVGIIGARFLKSSATGNGNGNGHASPFAESYQAPMNGFQGYGSADMSAAGAGMQGTSGSSSPSSMMDSPAGTSAYDGSPGPIPGSETR